VLQHAILQNISKSKKKKKVNLIGLLNVFNLILNVFNQTLLTGFLKASMESTSFMSYGKLFQAEGH